MTANVSACCPDHQKNNQASVSGETSNNRRTSSAGAAAIRHQPIKEEDSCCCKLSYADYCSIDGSRDLTTVSSTSNLQSPQLHANCRTGKLAEKLFEDEDESDFCASCASHPKVNLVLYCFGYIAFMIFASCIFSMTEKPVEIHYKAEMIKIQVDFLKQNPSVNVDSLNALLNHVTQLHGKGIIWEPLDPDFKFLAYKKNQTRSSELDREKEEGSSGEKKNNNNAHSDQKVLLREQRRGGQNKKEEKRVGEDWVSSSPAAAKLSAPAVGIDYSDFTSSVNWEFTSSLLFVTSLVTTIGYGHISPLTQFGKFLAIVFSMIGIPLTLTLLSTLSSLLLRSPVRRFETSLAIIATRMTSKANVLMVRLTHLIILTIILLIICFFIPAYLFHRLETEWTYLDSVYFCYISLTTIGLGDFVPAISTPGDSDLTYYRIASVLFLYFGLTFIMLWLALIYRIPQLNLNQILLSVETDNKLKARETLRILNTCTRVQETPSTSRSSISKSYGTQNTPTTP